MPLARDEAQKALERSLHRVKVVAWAPFEELYLFRVEYPSQSEKDWDPFFTVDKLTGDVRDFSVITDITSTEFLRLKWAQI